MENKIIIVTGHYGSGKTNFSVNLALQIAKKAKTALIDLDIVNPYFRAADSEKLLRESGIRVIIPRFANTNLDIPALPPEIHSVFSSGETAVFDVGGDDAGAIALGSYREKIKNAGYSFFYVFSTLRPLTDTPEKALEILREIENASGLKATALVNNTNLGAETTKETVLKSLPFAKKLSELSGLPVKYTLALVDISENLTDIENLYPIKIYTKPLW